METPETLPPEKMYPLAKTIATGILSRYRKKYIWQEDVTSEVWIAMVRAKDTWCPSFGIPWRYYASLIGKRQGIEWAKKHVEKDGFTYSRKTDDKTVDSFDEKLFPLEYESQIFWSKEVWDKLKTLFGNKVGILENVIIGEKTRKEYGASLGVSGEAVRQTIERISSEIALFLKKEVL